MFNQEIKNSLTSSELQKSNFVIYIQRLSIFSFLFPMRRGWFESIGSSASIAFMENTSEVPEVSKEIALKRKDVVQPILQLISDPLLVLSRNLDVITANTEFYRQFSLRKEEVEGVSVFDLFGNRWQIKELEEILEAVIHDGKGFKDYKMSLPGWKGGSSYLLNVQEIGEEEGAMVLTFRACGKEPSKRLLERKERYLKNYEEILNHAPAMICVLRGPEHIFELANSKYSELVGYRELLGKKVKEALPEVENQGFIEILNNVYKSGEPFFGEEVPVAISLENGSLRRLFLNFSYQPIKNSKGDVSAIFVHAIDVTEQVVARKKIEESELRLKEVIDTVPAMIWVTTKEGHSTYLNGNWYEYTGQKQEEAEGFGWLNAVHSADWERAKNAFVKANEDQSNYSISYRLKTKTGKYRWVVDRGRPRFSNGEYLGMIGTVVDVHEEKTKEKLLRQKEHRIRSIVEEATVATALYIGEDMKIELANDAMISLWGKDHSVIGKDLSQALPELEGQPFLKLLKDVYATGRTYWGKEDEVDLVNDGKTQKGYYNFTYKPLRDENGDIYGILNMAVDVTETVASKALLKERESYFRQLTDLMPEKVATSDPKGNFLYFNKGWFDYTGLSNEELKRWGWTQFIHPDEKEQFLQQWQQSLETGRDFEMELRVTDQHGFYKWHLSRAEAVRDENGAIKMWVGSNTEIQRIKEEEKRKEEFLKMVSHELKTPLTSIKGYVQLLLGLLNKGEEKPISSLPIKPSLERIDLQVLRLSRLISEILDISRINESQLELRKEPFVMNDLVSETIQDITYTNTQHDIDIIHEDTCEVNADKDRIGQVLINFVTNAIKYSPGNQKVEVRIRKRKKDEVTVTVKDWGIGIEKKNHKKIFKRFYRIDGKSTETYSGFGIGLYLADEIIRRHNGFIDVKSEKGKGSEFSFTLALNK